MSDSVRDRWYLRPGIWFWVVIALGAALRFYLVVFTEGTYDVTIWEQHARGVSELGLFDYYHSSPKANHPPFILEAESLLWRGAQSSGIPFTTASDAHSHAQLAENFDRLAKKMSILGVREASVYEKHQRQSHTL